MGSTGNFTFLAIQDAQLAELGALAERYFRDDPGTSVFKLRQFAELLSKTIAAHHALYVGERETFEETLRRLSYERVIPKEAAVDFARANFSLGDIGELQVPWPTARKRNEIAQRIQTAFAWIERVASEATDAYKLIDHLEQAVLAKAFQGELVLQDPNDEPASALLERIRAGRTEGGQKRHRR